MARQPVLPSPATALGTPSHHTVPEPPANHFTLCRDNGAAYHSRQVCEDKDYSFWLPNGASDPESWDVVVEGPEGQAGGVIEYGNKYKCEQNEGTEELGRVCQTWNGGWFFLKGGSFDAPTSSSEE